MSSSPAAPQNGSEQPQPDPPLDSDSSTPPPASTDHPDKSLPTLRPMTMYTRSQLVSLSKSPLVAPPPSMPELKVWFGSECENSVKKDDPPTPNAARERRGFRRDVDDGDSAPRPSFRSALTQTSQMGNFKHQSLRASDRDRDRDRDGDNNRDTQSVRTASEKYDRDKLAQPLSGTRNKERDPAPHLGSSAARSIQPLSSNAASRRAETRDGAKKKIGEASEDWRRGAEPLRGAREDRADTGKREDRTRSRVEDVSATKRDSSSSRKERDEPRERNARGDDSRRDRDLDSEDDPRRWKDDGKRDERLAARRDRGRDKANDDHKWESTGERRWPPGKDDDARFKRTTGRERKTNVDDTKDRDDRRDREREKEPAWMDNYVPSESSTGILGGELDGIQAWKRGLKEKESKEKEASIPLPSKASVVSTDAPLTGTLPSNTEKPLDEIQLFKLLMKKEQETKRSDSSVDLNSPRLSTTNDTLPGSSLQRQSNLTSESTSPSITIPKSELPLTQGPKPVAESITDSAFSLNAPSAKVQQLGELPQERNVSRLFPSSPETQINPNKQTTERINSPSFQPPPGSRLLALGRVPPKASNPAGNQPLNGGLQNLLPEQSQPMKVDPSRPPSGFSPFDEQMRQSYAFDEAREFGLPPNQAHLQQQRPGVDQGFGSHLEQNYNNVSANKVSRFAKFFDGKSRDGTPMNKPPGQGIPPSTSPLQSQRGEQVNFGGGGMTPNPVDIRAMDDIFTMLNNSSHQRNSLAQVSNAAPLMGNGGGFAGPGPNLHALQQQQQQQQQQSQQHQPQHLQQHLLQQTHLNNRLESLYDSRNEDRSFVPDGMVPGLRPLPPPPPRGRDNVGHFSDQIDESLQYNLQRLGLAPQQHQPQQHSRNVEQQLYNGQGPVFNQPPGRHNVLPLQGMQQPPPPFRGGPSPGLNQVNSLVNAQQQQRLPPGLANLGGRPPHEPAQFMGLQGHPSGNQLNALHSNGPLSQQQLPFNGFNGGNNGFNGTQVRGPGPGSHLLNNGGQQHPLGNLGHPNMDPRLANHHHLMGLGGSGVGGNRINGGFAQQGPPAPAHLGMRPQQQPQTQQQQQQQPHLLPHMLPHLMPPHLAHQGQGLSNNQQTHDLMALLMGGPHRSD